MRDTTMFQVQFKMSGLKLWRTHGTVGHNEKPRTFGGILGARSFAKRLLSDPGVVETRVVRVTVVQQYHYNPPAKPKKKPVRVFSYLSAHDGWEVIRCIEHRPASLEFIRSKKPVRRVCETCSSLRKK